ncbi:MAG: N-acetylneuraminate synthase family protein [Acidobacteriota bacterium]
MTETPPTPVRRIELDDRVIGPGAPCFVISEAGVNHNGDVEMALKLVDASANAGADAVKFQKRDLKSIYPRELLDNPNSAEWAFQYLVPILKQTELTEADFSRIKERCDERGIRFMCTPWDETSLALLEELGVDLYKVASADLVNLPLLDAIADTGKPMILSTGMATLTEIERTAAYLDKRGASYALLHCVSTYPAPFEALNLRFMNALDRFDVPVGYSGHERGIAIATAAVAMGASIIEKHITLDRTLPGPDHPASLEPGGLDKLIRDIRNLEMALGDGREKQLAAMEKLNRQVLRKSLVAARRLSAGHEVSREDVRVKGPGKGLSPQRLDELVGAVLDRNVEEDEYFTEGDLTTGIGRALDTSGLVRPWGFKARFHDLDEYLAKKPRLVELHFSDVDVDYPFEAPATPYPEQLIVHAPEFTGSRLLDLCSEDDETREIAIKLFSRTADKARELASSFSGGPIGVVVHVGGMSMDEPIDDHDRLLRRAIESLRQIDWSGLHLLPENLPPRPWYFGGQWIQNVFIRPEEMVEVCQELDVGMTFDLSHAQLYCNWAGTTLEDFVEQVLPYSRHLHIADASGIDGEGLQIGEGVIEWERIIEMMAGADVSWLPEIWSGHLHDGAGFTEAIHRLRELGMT